jgi:transposase-like protein
MTHYCENSYCENEATKKVHVSQNRSGDSSRWLCPACEEVFTWGVQHGYMVGKEHGDAVAKMEGQRPTRRERKRR